MRSGALIIAAHAELTAAILLVIETVFPDDLKATFLKTAFAPVLIPPDDLMVFWWNLSYTRTALIFLRMACVDSPEGHAASDLPHSPEAGLVDLVE